MAKVYVRQIEKGKRSAPVQVDDGDELRELERQGKAERLNADEVAALPPTSVPTTAPSA
jgi:hypothetical protein